MRKPFNLAIILAGFGLLALAILTSVHLEGRIAASLTAMLNVGDAKTAALVVFGTGLGLIFIGINVRYPVV